MVAVTVFERPQTGPTGPRRSMRVLLLAFAVLLFAAQTLAAMHRVSHPVIDQPSCKICTVASQPIAAFSSTLLERVESAVRIELPPLVLPCGKLPHADQAARAPPTNALFLSA